MEKVPPQIHTTTQGKKRVVRFVVAMRDIITTMTSPRAATNVVVELVVALFGSLLSRFDFDHQKRAYAAHILPVEIFEEERPKPFPAFESHEKKSTKEEEEKILGTRQNFSGCTVTPFFSPESSLTVAESVINDAKTSVDIFTPGVKFWSRERRNDTSCGGVLPSRAMEKESFPVFFALLNAARRNVTVRVLTNKYDEEEVGCDGRVTMKDFLSLAGVQVRYYQSTSFLHAKYIARDGGKALSISSVNWSRESMRENREAGVILQGRDSLMTKTLFDRASNRAFEYDWKRAQKHTRNIEDITKEEMAIIKGTTSGGVKPAEKEVATENMVRRNDIQNDSSKPFVTKMEPVLLGKGSSIELFVSPDFSRETLLRFIRSAKKVVYIYTYQITDDEIVDVLIDVSVNKNVKIFVMLSPRVYADWDRKKAGQVQTRLRKAGEGKNIIVYSAPKHFRYSHLKFIVKDGRDGTFETLVMTGNLSPSDFPRGNMFEPCHGKSSCNRANRDVNVLFREKDGAVASKFLEVFEGDLKMSTDYSNPTKY